MAGRRKWGERGILTEKTNFHQFCRRQARRTFAILQTFASFALSGKECSRVSNERVLLARKNFRIADTQ